MNIIILGPQGSGKGTQSRLLCEKYNLMDFDMGRILRSMKAEFPEIKKDLETGNLVPDEKVFEIATKYLKQKDRYDDIVFDGYPRGKVQFHALKDVLEDNGAEISIALKIDIPEEESIKRLSARRIHKTTGKIYNMLTNPPSKDIDTGELEMRKDDMPDAIKLRLERYKNVTEPMIEELAEIGLLITIDGTQSIEAIHAQIVSELQNRKILKHA